MPAPHPGVGAARRPSGPPRHRGPSPGDVRSHQGSSCESGPFLPRCLEGSEGQRSPYILGKMTSPMDSPEVTRPGQGVNGFRLPDVNSPEEVSRAGAPCTRGGPELGRGAAGIPEGLPPTTGDGTQVIADTGLQDSEGGTRMPSASEGPSRASTRPVPGGRHAWALVSQPKESVSTWSRHIGKNQTSARPAGVAQRWSTDL